MFGQRSKILDLYESSAKDKMRVAWKSVENRFANDTISEASVEVGARKSQLSWLGHPRMKE